MYNLNSRSLDTSSVFKNIVKPDLIKIEVNLVKLYIDIEQYSAKKLKTILDELVQYKNKISKEEFLSILERAIRTQRCEYYESKRILGVYKREVKIKTHLI